LAEAVVAVVLVMFNLGVLAVQVAVWLHRLLQTHREPPELQVKVLMAVLGRIFREEQAVVQVQLVGMRRLHQ